MPETMSDEMMDFWFAQNNLLDRWVIACGGTEVPGISRGRRYIYVWNPAMREHGYLDILTDTVYTTLAMNVTF
jgi:hypothetical protein